MYDLGLMCFFKSVIVEKMEKQWSKSAKELSVFITDSVKYTVLCVLCVILPAAALAFKSIWKLQMNLHFLQSIFLSVVSCPVTEV